MANTTQLSRVERKKAKRTVRKELKVLYRDFTNTQLSDFRKKSRGGVRGFLGGTNEENE